MTEKVTKDQVTLLFIDDALEEIDSIAQLCRENTSVLLRSFDDVEQSDLDSADLILVDFNLKDWVGRERATELTLRPGDGLAVIETLRSYYRANKSEQPVAFAVLSGDLESLTRPFPPVRREHMVASLAKVEWAFQKANPIADTARQLLSLGEGVRRLPRAWPHDSDAEKNETLHALLSVPTAHWATVATADVSRCHPPIQELSTWSHGLAFLRWMLQRILPYPTFLLNSIDVAIRLGIEPECFCESLENNPAFAEWMAAATFAGVLHNFHSKRFWKAGVDALIWELTVQRPFSKSALAEAMKAKIPDVKLLTANYPVACVGRNYEFVAIEDASDCVRIRPDDWPLFADSGWAKKELVREDQGLLMAVEDQADRAELGATAGE